MLTDAEIVAGIESRKPWYHSIQVRPNIITPGWNDIAPLWQAVRAARSGHVSRYNSARVLDLGSRDGLWAFEAAGLGARLCVATDVDIDRLERLLWLREVKGAQCVHPFYNVPVGELSHRLDNVISRMGCKFDIIQHLGLFYHLPDPMRSFGECAKCIAPGGMLLFESAIYLTSTDVPVMRFNSDGGVYSDPTTYWACNQAALYGALEAYDLEVDPQSVVITPQTTTIGRIALVAFRRIAR